MAKSKKRGNRKKFTFPNPKPIPKMIAYVLMIFLTGCTYWGWSGIQELLYKAGSYENLCDNVLEKSVMVIGGKEYIDCGPRKSGINNLFTIAYSAHFITSVFTGAFLDSLGSKYLYVIGQALNLVAWIFIGALPKVHCVLVTSFFVIGLTAESIYMPLLSLSYNFPNKRSLVISLLGSSRSLSYFIPSLMSLIYQLEFFKPHYLYIICTVYAVLGNLVCMIVGFLIVDVRFDSPLEEPEEIQEFELRIDSSKTLPLIDRAKNFFEKALTHDQLKEYSCLAFCSSIFLAAIGFVNKSHREMLVSSDKKSAVEIFRYMNILSFIPGPILGKLVDIWGAGIILWLLHSFCLGYYIFTALDLYASKICACVCYFFSSSLCVSITYCYVNQRFPRKYFGVLVGFIFFVAGIVNLFNIPLYNLGSKTWEHDRPYNFMRISYILVGCMILCLMGSAYLVMINRKGFSCRWWRSKKNKNKTKEDFDKFLMPNEDVMDNLMMTSQDNLENLISCSGDSTSSNGDVELGAGEGLEEVVVKEEKSRIVETEFKDTIEKQEII
ncbi:uncharacterized protein TA05145 [Theileria annulata]|uniref:Major Facilitator Superfamily n=1 Tax=Theileria annulata TaxID=5874 RepID=Q4UBN8_THEAN|nr:uncharacterized protein TA05145 [Theileria annulata]CAI75763.1 hypothetical protein, conserved [Theileria annulata]|eukprot:XP_955239.1 hypothetical protein, conserved [Theileria annulata]